MKINILDKMVPATLAQYIDVCSSCIIFLSDKYYSEKGLFRFAVSATDVRNFQKEMINGRFSQFFVEIPISFCLRQFT